jgi:hypothetical protein
MAAAVALPPLKIIGKRTRQSGSEQGKESIKPSIDPIDRRESFCTRPPPVAAAPHFHPIFLTQRKRERLFPLKVENRVENIILTSKKTLFKKSQIYQ